MDMIDVKNLSVTFGHGAKTVQAVREASFCVVEGESFGIVGESGSGKSTILRALSGLNPQWSGEMRIAGLPMQRKRPRSFYKTLQMVFQDPYASLHPRRTIDDALNEPLAIHGMDNHEARIRAALDAVALPQIFRFRYPHQLSGGQRQRVAIARALILEPKVLLLDEPTSALDVSIQAEILNLLRALRREHGLTYLLVSHNLAVIAYMCERLIVMTEGRIVETLTREDLQARRMQHPYTRELLTASEGFHRAAS